MGRAGGRSGSSFSEGRKPERRYGTIFLALVSLTPPFYDRILSYPLRSGIFFFRKKYSYG
jgi:hypothetical protein